MYITYSTAVTVGFEQTRYSFSEPPAGVNLQLQMICVTVNAGELGTSLELVPAWNPATALGTSNSTLSSAFMFNM